VAKAASDELPAIDLLKDKDMVSILP